MSQPAQDREAVGLRSSIMRLAQFRPFGTGQLQNEEILRSLVLTAAHEASPTGVASLAGFREDCRTLWGIELELDELRETTARLCELGLLRKTGPAYRLTDSGSAEIERRRSEQARVEAEAFTEWEAAVRVLAPGVDQAQLDVLREDLVCWLQQIVVRHGVEAAMVLYPEDERGRRVLGEIEQYGTEFLPDRSETLTAIRPQALYLFLHRPSPAQRTFIANLMTTAFMVASFTLDPRAAGRVQQLTAGQVVYLDTNVVYDALNLNGPQLFLSTKRMLDLTRGLGFELAVTPWTLAEMKETLRRQRQELARTRLPPRALAELAADATGDASFVTAYWRKYKETGVTVEDFTAMYAELDHLIERLGITITDKACKAIDHDDAAIVDQMSLIEQVPGGHLKSEHVKRHDVKHRLLIERLRGDGNRRFSNAGYWFLTRDSVLIPYGRSGGEHEDTLPFAVSTTAWLHIVRSFTPRTDDYEQTLVDLLDTPSIRPAGTSPVNYQAVADVLGRVDHMVSDSSEEIATRILLDHAAMAGIDRSTGKARESRIDREITTKTEEMRRQLAESDGARAAAEQRATATAIELDRHRQQVSELTDKLSSERDARQQAEQRLREAGEQHASSQQAASAAIQETQRQHADELSKLRDRLDRQQLIARVAVGGIVLVLAIASAVVPIATGLVTGGLDWALAIAGAGGIGFLGLWLLFSWRKAAGIASALALVIGTVAALHDFAPHDHAATPPTKPARAP